MEERRLPWMKRRVTSWPSTMAPVLAAYAQPSERAGHLGDVHGVRREPGLHLGVPEGDRQDRDAHDPQQRAVAAARPPSEGWPPTRRSLGVLVERAGAAPVPRGRREQHDDVDEVGQRR